MKMVGLREWNSIITQPWQLPITRVWSRYSAAHCPTHYSHSHKHSWTSHHRFLQFSRSSCKSSCMCWVPLHYIWFHVAPHCSYNQMLQFPGPSHKFPQLCLAVCRRDHKTGDPRRRRWGLASLVATLVLCWHKRLKKLTRKFSSFVRINIWSPQQSDSLCVAVLSQSKFKSKVQSPMSELKVKETKSNLKSQLYRTWSDYILLCHQHQE